PPWPAPRVRRGRRRADVPPGIHPAQSGAGVPQAGLRGHEAHPPGVRSGPGDRGRMSDPSPGARLAQVVVGLPVPRVFSYVVPPPLVPQLAPGHRVRVPFQRRSRAGVVVALESGEGAGLEPVEALLDPVPALTEPLLALARWAADETA